MGPLGKHERRRLWPAALVLSGIALIGAAGVLAARDPAPAGPPALPARSAEPRQQQAPIRRPRAAASAVGKSIPMRRVQKPNPVRIVIPAISVSAPVIPLGLNPDRTLEVPKNFAETGWFTGGPEPGERGGAVIAGHVDSKTGPAVFYRLRQLVRGDVINILLEDRSTVRFVVSSSMAVPKNRFPTKLVYSKAHDPALRLITCGGTFDRATGHYLDNYIVFATLDERR
jgi:LPXTG-site transpeptidase (sortase) family protein